MGASHNHGVAQRPPQHREASAHGQGSWLRAGLLPGSAQVITNFGVGTNIVGSIGAGDAADMERHNANYVGGDINAGIADLRQFFIRPTRRLYATSNPQIYICSASTPPGGGVHGMCGAWAARTALRRAAW